MLIGMLNSNNRNAMQESEITDKLGKLGIPNWSYLLSDSDFWPDTFLENKAPIPKPYSRYTNIFWLN